ncbi:YidH family protein [Sulfobacillus thermosulfidooxidans]|uniref:YidH family protein n=1 Tax=Sulfobacillus thermosulfidooxidans TaxID=28034 RepID=UPI0006B559BF|nr:DUF202 domain-containing protein [Sulfobacillus thermosulfidooxidans]
MTQDDRRLYYTDPRVLLANERSLLSWMRMALYLMGFAFLLSKAAVIDKVLDPGHQIQLLPMVRFGHMVGGMLSLMATFLEVVALVRYYRNMTRWHRAEDGRGSKAPTFFGSIILVWVVLLAIYLLS